jgi:hypothetical protein
MDISYLKNNYDLIIEHGIHYYSHYNDKFYNVYPLDNQEIHNIQTIFKLYNDNNDISDKFYNKINSKLDNSDLGAFWHYKYDNSYNKIIIRIIFDNAQIFTDASFNKILKIYKPTNNISFKKYKKIKKYNKTIKKIIYS